MDLVTIQSRIFEIRGQKVMLDRDLAEMYGVETKRLKEAVKRNLDRFPEDFMFHLTNTECNLLNISLRSQFATSNNKSDERGRGGSRYAPYVFTEQGVAMLSAVLKSETAVLISINIMRAFVAIRQSLYSSMETVKEIQDLKDRVMELENGAEQTLEAINDLSEDVREEMDTIYLALTEMSGKRKEADEKRKRIGFK